MVELVGELDPELLGRELPGIEVCVTHQSRFPGEDLPVGARLLVSFSTGEFYQTLFINQQKYMRY